MSQNRKWFSLVSLLIVAAVLISACAPVTTPTTPPPQPTQPPPPPTQPPKPTEVPTEAPPAFEPMSYSAPDCNYGGIMKSIEAVDEHTVKFTECEPDPAFPSKVAFSSLGIHSAKQLEETGGGGELLEKALGTGPYMVKEWVRGDHLTLVANPNYWGDPPKTKTIIFKWNSEAAARLTALKSGEADGIDNPGRDDFEAIKADPSLALYPRTAMNVFYVGMNNTLEPFDDEQVRQAIAMGIDRQAIVDKFYPPGSEAASHFTPCIIPGGCEGEAWYEYNPEKAKELLAAAGYAKGFDVTLSYRDVVRGYLPTPGKVAEEIQSQLKQYGIKVTIEVQESGTFIANAGAGKLPFFLLGWGADYPDMTDFLDVFFGQGASPRFGAPHEDIVKLLAEARTLSDQAKRNELYAKANTLIKRHAPMVAVAHGGSADVFSADVKGAHSSPLSTEIWKVLEAPGKDTLVWMQNAEPLSLYCADESDGETLRACEQVFDALLSYKIGGTEVEPGLAEKCEPNADLSEWTCTLREGAKFSDGTPVTANDVVMTFAVQWDAKHPLHVGNSGLFEYWTFLFASFLNPPAQ